MPKNTRSANADAHPSSTEAMEVDIGDEGAKDSPGEEDNAEGEEEAEESGEDEGDDDSDGEGEDDSEDDSPPAPTLAATRERRAKAGSRMSRLLNAEEAAAQEEGAEGATFYATAYGGFQETASDSDYAAESSDTDRVDSDFDNDEAGGADAGADDDAEDEDGPRRPRQKRGLVVTKAYKEPRGPPRQQPTQHQPQPQPQPQVAKKRRGRPSAASTAAAAAAAASASASASASAGLISATRSRRVTAAASLVATNVMAAGQRRLRRSHLLPASRPTAAASGKAKPGADPARKSAAAAARAAAAGAAVRRLTQEELLAEAELTEQLNLRSLARYQRLEVEKKKCRGRQPVASGPMVRFDSYTTRVIDEDAVPLEVTEVNTDTGDSVAKATIVLEPAAQQLQAADAEPQRKCARNFVSFTHQETFASGFSLSRRPPAKNPFCPISNQPARYFDPLTQTPYRDARSFRVLRTLYAMHHATGVRPAVLLKQFIQGEISVP